MEESTSDKRKEKMELALNGYDTCIKGEDLFLSSLDIDKLGETMGKEPFNPEVHELLSCILKTIMKKDPITGFFLRRKYLTDFEDINVSSDRLYPKYEVELSAGIKGYPGIFGIRCSTSNSSTISENAYNSLFTMNKIKKEIPNFQYVYGFFAAGRMKMYEMVSGVTGGKMSFLVDWDDTDKQGNYYYIFEEPKGRDFFSQLGDLDDQDIINLFLQLCLSLQLVTLRFGISIYYSSKNFLTIKRFFKPINVKYSDIELPVSKALILDNNFSIDDNPTGFNANITTIKSIFRSINNHFNEKRSKRISCAIIHEALGPTRFKEPWEIEKGKIESYGEKNMDNIIRKLYYALESLESPPPKEIYFSCQVSPCLKREELIAFPTSELKIKIISDLYEYLSKDGDIKLIDFDIEKISLVFIRGLEDAMDFIKGSEISFTFLGTKLGITNLEFINPKWKESQEFIKSMISAKVGESEVKTLNTILNQIESDDIRLTKARAVFEEYIAYLAMFDYCEKKLNIKREDIEKPKRDFFLLKEKFDKLDKQFTGNIKEIWFMFDSYYFSLNSSWLTNETYGRIS